MDRASLETDRNFTLRIRDRERKLIKKIDETIARIDANEYGYCESCGVEIGLETVQRLAKTCKNIVGIKESSGNVKLAGEIVAAAAPGFQTLVGSAQTLYGSLQAGAGRRRGRSRGRSTRASASAPSR